MPVIYIIGYYIKFRGKLQQMRWIISKRMKKKRSLSKDFSKNDFATKKVLICLWQLK